MKQKTNLFLRLFVALSVFSIVGCSAGFFTYNGLVISEENIFRLENGGPHDGIMQTDDLALRYRYTRTSDNLLISGEIHFADRLKYNYRWLERFDIWIHFINSENTIVGYEYLDTFGYYLEIDRIPFSKTMELPSDVKGVSFSYSGRVTEGGGSWNDPHGGGISLDFWRTPDG